MTSLLSGENAVWPCRCYCSDCEAFILLCSETCFSSSPFYTIGTRLMPIFFYLSLNLGLIYYYMASRCLLTVRFHAETEHIFLPDMNSLNSVSHLYPLLRHSNCKLAMSVPGPCEPEDLIDGIIFAANYLGSTQLLSERNPSKNIRMMQAQEAVSRVKVGDFYGLQNTLWYSDSWSLNMMRSAASNLIWSAFQWVQIQKNTHHNFPVLVMKKHTASARSKI